MSYSFPLTVPSAILKADNLGKITSEESKPVCIPGRRTQNPTSYLDDSFPFFQFINSHGLAESLDLVSGLKSTFCPDFQLFWLKYLFFVLTFASQLLVFEWQTVDPEFGNKMKLKKKYLIWPKDEKKWVMRYKERKKKREKKQVETHI